MYQLLLTRRYLLSKIMPLLAAVAVALGCAMMMIVWSVMGGFLDRLLEAGRGMVGDVTVTWPNTGFRHYEDLIKRLEADPAVAAAAPAIDTFGILSLPDGRVEGVQVRAVEPVSYAKVVGYHEALWWKPIDKPLRKDAERKDPRLAEENRRILQQSIEDGMTLSEPDPVTGQPVPAAVLGIELSGFSLRRAEGYYDMNILGRTNPDGTVEWIRRFAPTMQVTLRLVPLDKVGRSIDLVSRPLPVANELKSGVMLIDGKQVLIPLSLGQQMLRLDEAVREDAASRDPYTDEPIGPVVRRVDPARATTILVRAKDGVSPDELRARVIEVYRAFAKAHADVPRTDELVDANQIRTWEMTQAQFIGTVKKETTLVVGMIVFMTFVAAILILAIFWAMISEKTKDIGILRAVGASRSGVALTWVMYGAAIGLVGATLGTAFGAGVVANLNAVHDFLAQVLRTPVWDPKVYYFTELPSRVDPWKVALCLSMGLGFSVIGAIIPAVRAAWLDPVKSLRFE